MELTDKVAVVTGGGGGIGRALARALARAGASVTVADIDGEAAERVALEIGGLATRCDVGVESDIESLVVATEDLAGPIDLYFSNAGIAPPGDPWFADEAWMEIWQINVMSHVYAARALLPPMLERGSGHIVITASAAGLLTQLGSAPYAVTKHAAVAFAEYLSIAYGDRGISVSVLAPQAVRTAMTEGITEGELTVAAVDGILEPEDVADAMMQSLATGRFLVLPHPQVEEYMRRKTADYDRWLAGMRRLQDRLIP